MLQCLWGERLPLTLTTVELGVQLHCEGCERRIREKLWRMEGVDSVDVDSELQKVTVSGYVEPRKVLRAVRRTGAMAEYWPFPTDAEHYAYLPQYYQQHHETMLQSAAYRSHDHHDDRYGHGYAHHGDAANADMEGPGLVWVPSYTADQSGALVGNRTASMFSDDNVHACSVM